MTKALKSKPKSKGRPKKVVLTRKVERTIKNPEPEIINWEGEGGFVPIDDEDIPRPLEEILGISQKTLTTQMMFRKKQWDSLDEFSKKRLRMTEEEFLSKEDVTGFGPNSYFTPLSER